MEGKQVCPESESCPYASPECMAPTENRCLHYIHSLKESLDQQKEKGNKLYAENIRLQWAIMDACKTIENFSESVNKLQDTVTAFNAVAREIRNRYYDI